MDCGGLLASKMHWLLLKALVETNCWTTFGVITIYALVFYLTKKGLFGWDSCKREFALSVLTVKEALGCLLSNCLFDGQLIDLFDLKSGRTTR